MTYQALLDKVQARHNDLFTSCRVFWAFSAEQFKEQAPEGVKLVSIGMGGYMPKSEYDRLITGLADLKEYTRSMRQRINAEEAILYELRNHECFYTGSIDDAVDALDPLGYTPEQVKKVYFAHYDTELSPFEQAIN